MAFSNRKKALWIKEQSGSTFDAPSSSDDIAVAELTYSTGSQRAQTNEFNGSIDETPETVQTLRPTISGKVYLRGYESGTPAALQISALLKACGFAETITSSAIPGTPASTSGGTSGTQATLGGSVAGTADLYEGAPITFTGESFSGVAGRTQTFITRYTGGRVATLAEDAGGAITGDHQIPPHVLYNLAADSFPVLSAYYFEDGYRVALKDLAISSFSFTMPDPQGTEPPYINFEAIGSLEGDSDIATPFATQTLKTPPYRQGRFYLDRTLFGGTGFTVDVGPSAERPSDVNEADGARAAQVLSRNKTGQLNLLRENKTHYDLVAKLQSQDPIDMFTQWGTTEGSRFGLTLSRVRLLDIDPGDQGGFLGNSIPISIEGANTGIALAVY